MQRSLKQSKAARTERMRCKGVLRIGEEVHTNRRMVILSEFIKKNIKNIR